LLPDRSGRWWGLNTNDFNAPEVVTDIQVFQGGALEIAAGLFHRCVLLQDGKVRCWGDNSQGALGYGKNDSESNGYQPNVPGVPDVPVGGPVKQIVAGERHTCALLEGGKVRCWGMGETILGQVRLTGNGRLGYGNTEQIGDDETPEAAGDVDVGGEVLELAAGYEHTCALLAGDAVRCWGSNDSGQLGYGHTEDIGDDETPASAGDVPYR
jgi:alpha-tubulin suppressor-like RCC1 family protein